LLDAVAPAALQIPEPLLKIIPPRPEGFPRHRELFANHTAETFDALAPAEAAADLTFAAIFEPGRCARLVEQSGRDAKMPALDEVLAQATAVTWQKKAGGDYAGEVQRTVNYVMLTRLIGLAANPDATPQVRAVAMAQLTVLRDWLRTARQSGGPAQQAHVAYGAQLITQFLEHPKEFVPPRVPAPPPGQPIGCDFGL
jgi:hypothetical protein